MKYIVYVTKNIVNDVLYIGVHQTKDPNVFDGYIGCGVNINKPNSYYNPKTPFQMAVKTYGPKKFIRNIIKVFDIKEDAYKLESELITWKEVYSDKYYNATPGGAIPEYSDYPIYQYNINGEYLKEWTLESASEFYNMTESAFRTALRHKQKAANFYWSKDKMDKLNLEEYSKPNLPTTVYKYSREGVCVGIYESIQSTENPGRVCTAIQTKRPYKDHYYSNTLYEKYNPVTKQNLRGVEIFIYDENGEYVGSEIGVTKVMNRVGGRSRESVYNAINTGKPYKGFRFSLVKVDKMEPYKNKLAKKSVDVFDMYGNLLKTYNSINLAVKDLKLDNSSAHRVLKGTQNQTKGYILKYH